MLEATHGELPFTTAVVLDGWRQEAGGRLRITASLLVEKPGQKKILIGKGGSMIKRIGTAARLDLQQFLERPVFLDLQVRLEPEWREDRRLLAEMEQEPFGALLEPAADEPPPGEAE